MEKQIVILGAGAAGLGANYSLKQKGYNPIVLEKDETYGGLCGNFMIAGLILPKLMMSSIFSRSQQICIFINLTHLIFIMAFG